MGTEPRRPGFARRRLLQGGLAASAALAATTAATAVEAHVPKPGEWKSDLVQSLVSRPAKHKALFSNANIEAPQLAQMRNWLNAVQFSYQTPAQDILVIAGLYGSANLLNYNDISWAKYRFGEKYGVIDPKTGLPATRNIFQPRTGTDNGSLPPDSPKSLWQEFNITALQKRGVIFLVCHNTIDNHARAAWTDGRNPDNLSVQGIADDLTKNIVSWGIPVPAMVGEITRLQEMGFPLIVVPSFRG